MSHITRDEVERVAALARLSLTDEEAQRMLKDLESILDYVETLGQLDTEGVEPTSHAIPLATPMRDDRAGPPIGPERAVMNAPERSGSAGGCGGRYPWSSTCSSKYATAASICGSIPRASKPGSSTTSISGSTP